jgi:predicted RND superfamily exporter protein
LYENAGGNDLEKLTDFDYSKANIVALIRGDFTPELKKVKQKAEAYTTANFGSEVEVTYAGCSTLCVIADDLIIPGQLKSLGIAFVVVLVLLTLIFRSIKYGLIALLPMVLTVLLVFLLIGTFGVYLDAVLAIIASIVLGIGVDYSVHFLSRYQRLRSEGIDFKEAIRETLDTSGRAIVFNSLAVAIGFLVLLLSSFWPVIHMGWIVSANMIFSALLTMILLPAILRTWSTKKEKVLVVEESEPKIEKVKVVS